MDAERVFISGRISSSSIVFLKKSGGGRDYIKISCNFVGEKYYNRKMNPKSKNYGYRQSYRQTHKKADY